MRKANIFDFVCKNLRRTVLLRAGEIRANNVSSLVQFCFPYFSSDEKNAHSFFRKRFRRVPTLQFTRVSNCYSAEKFFCIDESANTMLLCTITRLCVLTIDSFINVPLILIAVASCILFVFLIFVKYRNTAKTTFVFYLSLGVIVCGAVYAIYEHHPVYFIIAVLAAELMNVPYVIILAFGNEKEKPAQITEEANSAIDYSLVEQFAAMGNATNENTIDEGELYHTFAEKASTFTDEKTTLAALLDYAAETLNEKIHADGSAILLVDAFNDVLTVRSLSGFFIPPYRLPETLPHETEQIKQNFSEMEFQFSGNIFGDIFSNGESLLVPDASLEDSVFQNTPEDFLKANSYIFVPVKINEKTAGIACACRALESEKFGSAELDIAKKIVAALSPSLSSIINFMRYDEKRNLNVEGQIAAKFHRKFLPNKIPRLPGISCGFFSIPCENACEDFYDIIPARKDRISFILGDIAGKGMNSFTIMVMLRAMLRLIVNTPQEASTILNWANRGLYLETAMLDHFASVTLLNYNPLTRNAVVATSGLHPMLFYSAKEKKLLQISKSTEPLGVQSEANYAEKTIAVSNGDMFITCTDGFLESLNESGEQYSLYNLARVIETNYDKSADEIAKIAKKDLQTYCGNAQQYDDASLMIIKIQ